MSNPVDPRRQAQAAPAFRAQLALARAAEKEIRSLTAAPPAKPVGFTTLLERASEGLDSLPADVALAAATREVRAVLYSAEGHERQCDLLWREALTTSLFAARIARASGLSAGAACFAGLLHRVGEALALLAIGNAERAAHAKIDVTSRSRIVLQAQRGLTEALLRSWQLPAAVGAAVLGWRQMGELGVVTRESMAVYFGHLLAVESLYPQFCTEGLADSLGADLGFDHDTIAALRTQGVTARELMLALC
jgi:hypothetical protein